MRPTSVATAVFNPLGQALILRRGLTAPWMPGRWNLPGGSLDPGETWFEGAARETEEETQLLVQRAQYLVTLGDPVEGWAVAFFVAKPGDWAGRLVLNYESDAYAWVTSDELKDYAFVPTVKEALSQAFSQQSTRLNSRQAPKTPSVADMLGRSYCCAQGERPAFYHVTSMAALPSILARGIRPGAGQTYTNAPYTAGRIFLAVGWSTATLWADTIGDVLGGSMAILEVSLTPEQLKALKVDDLAYQDGFECSFYLTEVVDPSRVAVVYENYNPLEWSPHRPPSPPRRYNGRGPISASKSYLGHGASATAYSADDGIVYLHVHRDDGARQVLARLYAEGVPHMPAIEVLDEGWYCMPRYRVPPVEDSPADDLLSVLLMKAHLAKGGLSATAARLPDHEKYDSLREALYALVRALGAGWMLDLKPENFGEDEQGNLVFLDPVYSPTFSKGA